MMTKLYILGGHHLDTIRTRAFDQGLLLTEPDPDCLLLSDEPIPHSLTKCRRSYLGLPLDPTVIDGMGFKPYPDVNPQFTLSLRWDGKWDEQLLCSIPVYGTANDNLGPQKLVGWGSRYVNRSKLRIMFESNEVTALVDQLQHRGFVSCGLTFGNGKLHVCSMWLGFPPLLFWHAVSGAGESFGKFFHCPLHRLYESWTLGTLVYSNDANETTATHTYLTAAAGYIPLASKLLREKCMACPGQDKSFRTDTGIQVRKGWAQIVGFVRG